MGLASVPLPVQASIGLELETVLVDVFVEANSHGNNGRIKSGRITPQHGFRFLGQWWLPVGEQTSADPAVDVRFGSQPFT